MTPEQVAQVLAVIKAQYGPQFQTNAATTQAWSMVLDDVPYEAVMPVLRTWAKEHEWPPNAAQLRNAALGNLSGLPSAADAWMMVQLRIKNTYPGHPTSAWDAPRAIQNAVDAVGGLWSIRMTEKPEQMRQRFEGAYRDEYQRVKQMVQREQALGTGNRKEIA